MTSLNYAEDNPFLFADHAGGSGKTHLFRRLAIRAAGDWFTQTNYIYAAPTRELLDEVKDDLERDIAESGSPLAVAKIHSEADQRDDRYVSEWALDTINAAWRDNCEVVLLTTETFMNILTRIDNPGDFVVFMDEAIQPCTDITLNLRGNVAKRERQREAFFDVFTGELGQSLRAARNASREVKDMARGKLAEDAIIGGSKAMQQIAQAVESPMMDAELVRNSAKQIFVVTYVKPDMFQTFRSVTFLVALFKRTVLYQLWQALGARFERHEYFDQNIRGDMHQMGKHLRVDWLLDDGDNTSKDVFIRNAETGQPKEKRKGKRVIDYLATLAAEVYGGEPFLLQSNTSWTAFLTRAGRRALPSSAEPIKVNVHGVNKYGLWQRCAILVTTNPSKALREWLERKLKMNAGEVCMLFRFPNFYQTSARFFRDPEVKHGRWLLVPSRADAEALCEVWSGSTLGTKMGGAPCWTWLWSQRPKDVNDRPQQSPGP